MKEYIITIEDWFFKHMHERYTHFFGCPIEEIVRCCDCKHFTPKGTHKFENGKVNADYCKYVRGWMLQITPDGFCAWGEKRND